MDVDQIGIDFNEANKPSKKKCLNGHLATISYVGALEDGQVVTDSLQEFGGN